MANKASDAGASEGIRYRGPVCMPVLNKSVPPDCIAMHARAHSGLERDIVERAIYYSSEIPFVYIMNNKAACSSIIKSMFFNTWKYYDKGLVKIFEENIFDKEEVVNAIEGTPFISAVRNPYTRILSAYLNKIAAPDIPNYEIYNKFMKKFYPKIRNNRNISFVEFLMGLYFEHPRRMDVHFRPQYLNLQSKHAHYQHIFSVEDFGKIACYLEKHNIISVNELRHSTSSYNKNILHKYYCEVATELVRVIYKNDFLFFKYSENFEDCLAPPNRVDRKSTRVTPSDLIRFIRGQAVDFQDPQHELYYDFMSTTSTTDKIRIAQSFEEFDDHVILGKFEKAMRDAAPHLAKRIARRKRFIKTRHQPWLLGGAALY